MWYIVYSKRHGPLAKIEGSLHEASLREGEIAIPCEADADVNDRERWEIEAEYMAEQYAPTLDMAKGMKRDELMRVRDSVVAEGFPYGGHVYPLDQDVQLALMQQFLGSQIMPAPSYAWKDAGGVYREIGDVQAFQGFCAMAMMYGQSLFSKEEMLQGLVNAAPSVEDVAAITWNTVPEEPV